jgi:peptidase M28-like protein
VVDLRLYRIAFLPALLALVALLFSLQSQPGPLRPLVAPAGFDKDAATRFARQIVARAPDRSPGSPGDARAAAIVHRTFRTVSAGEVLVQRFGAGGRLANVIMKLPGQTSDQIVLIAPRDTAAPPGAASSAAATGALEELAASLGTTQHSKTIVLVSTDGASSGAAGAGALADDYLDRGAVDAIVALEQPGAASPTQPFVLDSSTGAESDAIQLVRTAEVALTDQTGLHAREPGPFGQLAALALPAGLGEQSALIARGFDAVGLSSAGERPLRPVADQPADFSGETLDAFGRTAFDLVLALDSAPGPTVHGPDAYVEVAGNLVPGWALATMALALILPALVAAVDAIARAGRRGAAGAALAWAALRPLPLLAALLLLYLLALVGIVPRPSFPFDPGRFAIGFAELLALAVLIGAAAATWSLLGRNRMPARLEAEAAATAVGLYATAALLLIWLVNPYLALLLVPLAHPWVIEASAHRRGGPLRTGGAVAIALVPLVLGAASVAGRLDLGAALPWQVTLAIGDWGIEVPIALAGCVLAGSLAALLVVAAARPAAAPAWTNSRSRNPRRQPIYRAEPGQRPGSANGDDRIALGEETRGIEATDRREDVQDRLAGRRPRDPAEGGPDQAGSDRARGTS